MDFIRNCKITCVVGIESRVKEWLDKNKIGGSVDVDIRFEEEGSIAIDVKSNIVLKDFNIRNDDNYKELKELKEINIVETTGKMTVLNELSIEEICLRMKKIYNKTLSLPDNPSQLQIEDFLERVK